MSDRAPMLILLSDQLETPPRLGYHVHLLSLARGAAAHAPVAAFCWGERGTAAPEHVQVLDAAAAPAGLLARKRHYVARALAWAAEHAGPGSVLWVRGYSTAALLLMRLPGRVRRARGWTLLYDVSSLGYLEARAKGGRPADLARAAAEELLLPAFDRIRTLSDPMGEYLAGRGVPRRKLLVVPVGAEPPARTWQARHGGSRLLYLGSRMPWQGLERLLAAMGVLEREASPARLSVVGLERGELPAPLPGNVEPRGRLPHAAVASAYLEHDLFVLPRPRTPLTELVVPMKIPEAMAFGIPILATDLGAVRWMTGDDGALLVPDAEPGVLARALREALAAPERLRAVAARGLERSRAFTWDAIGRRLAAELRPAP